VCCCCFPFFFTVFCFFFCFVLQPTQESIRDAKDWIMARARLSSDIVSVFKSKIAELPAFAPRLHLLYLVNDVLLHSGRAPQDYFGPALQRHLSDLCIAACDPQFAGKFEADCGLKTRSDWDESLNMICRTG
jgi:hypothetical protein